MQQSVFVVKLIDVRLSIGVPHPLAPHVAPVAPHVKMMFNLTKTDIPYLLHQPPVFVSLIAASHICP